MPAPLRGRLRGDDFGIDERVVEQDLGCHDDARGAYRQQFRGAGAGAHIFDRVHRAADAPKGLLAFKEKRKPNWKGA